MPLSPVDVAMPSWPTDELRADDFEVRAFGHRSGRLRPAPQFRSSGYNLASAVLPGSCQVVPNSLRKSQSDLLLPNADPLPLSSAFVAYRDLPVKCQRGEGRREPAHGLSSVGICRRSRLCSGAKKFGTRAHLWLRTSVRFEHARCSQMHRERPRGANSSDGR